MEITDEYFTFKYSTTEDKAYVDDKNVGTLRETAKRIKMGFREDDQPKLRFTFQHLTLYLLSNSIYLLNSIENLVHFENCP